MNDYQREQQDALTLATNYLGILESHERRALCKEMAGYIEFRNEVEQFLSAHCGQICSLSCYTSKTSACCSKDGIITFWADVLINACCSDDDQLTSLMTRIQNPQYNHKCIYLTEEGCEWKVRPLVCTMFLCDPVQNEVLAKDEVTRSQWEKLQERAKSYRWPDRPVLFDQLELRCMAGGIQSPLMYINNSPGLLRVKHGAGLVQPKAGDCLRQD